MHDEAQAALTAMTLGKRVSFVPYRRDQYQRIVANVFIPPRFFIGKERNVSIELLRQGFACVYRQYGAEYGGMLKQFEEAEAEAKRYKRGIWGLKDYVSPAEHKKKFKQAQDPTEAMAIEEKPVGLWQRLRKILG